MIQLILSFLTYQQTGFNALACVSYPAVEEEEHRVDAGLASADDSVLLPGPRQFGKSIHWD